jgi:hypothetical protein
VWIILDRNLQNIVCESDSQICINAISMSSSKPHGEYMDLFRMLKRKQSVFPVLHLIGFTSLKNAFFFFLFFFFVILMLVVALRVLSMLS